MELEQDRPGAPVAAVCAVKGDCHHARFLRQGRVASSMPVVVEKPSCDELPVTRRGPLLAIEVRVVAGEEEQE